MQPRVAVVIATYNTAQFVGEAVRSVLDQSCPDVELVVVDDGSTDDTHEVLAAFAADPRFRMVRQENQGQTAAKNRGIAATSAPVIGFCDADDHWHPRKLELQLPALEDPAVGVVYSREQRFVEGPEGRRPIEYRVETCHSGRVTAPLFIENFVPFGTALVRRSVLEQAGGGFDTRYRMGIDWALWLRLSQLCEFRFVDEVTYFYRVWEQQMSRDWRGRYDNAFRIMRDFLASHPDAVPPHIVRRAMAHTYANRALARAQADRELSAAFGDLARALRHAPAFSETWMAGARVCRAGVRALLSPSRPGRAN